MSDKDRLILLADQIHNNDAMAQVIGQEIASVFKLKRDKEHNDRWLTSIGSKTDIGLAKTMVYTFEKNGYDVETAETGAEFAAMLSLKKDSEYRDRFQTSSGSKTYLGVVASLSRIICDKGEEFLADHKADEDSSQGMA